MTKKTRKTPGLGAIVFTRDPARRGRTRRQDEGYTLEEVQERAEAVGVAKEYVPAPPSDRRILSRLLSRLYATGGARGVSIKQVKKDKKGILVQIYERQGDSMELIGTLQWQTAQPGEIVGIDHWVVNETRNEFESLRNRIGLAEWTDHLRNLLQDKWSALAARHEGRVYWVPENQVDLVRRMSALTESLEVFGIVVLPLDESQKNLVSTIIHDWATGGMATIQKEVNSFTGKENVSRYKRVERDMHQLLERFQWYVKVGAPGIVEDPQAVIDGILAAKRVVMEDYAGAAEIASEKAGGTKRKRARTRRKDHLGLPAEAPPPPAPPPPVEVAPLPEPYLTLNGVTLRRDPSLDKDTVRCFISETDNTDGAFDALKEAKQLDTWVGIGNHHAYIATNAGPPRVYLTEVNKEIAKGLQDTFGIELHL
jgi:hypothetical protein